MLSGSSVEPISFIPKEVVANLTRINDVQYSTLG